MSTFLFTDWDEEQAQRQIAKTSKQEIRLRPYQLAAVDAVYEQWETVRATMLNMATGLGKSVCFAETMRRWDVSTQGKILLIAHRRELILQAIGHAMRAGLSSGIEMAGKHATGEEDVIVASVQTLNASRKCGRCFGEGCDECYDGKVKRFTRFNPRDFGLLVCDEFHHFTAKSNRNVMTWFAQNPLQKTLGVTATPRRADKAGLHNICQSVAYTMELRQAIDEGWLVPIRQKFVTVEGLDISKVDIRAGKLNEGQVEAAFLGTDEEEERMLHSIVKPTIDEAAGRKTLVFAAGKDHASKLASCFAAHGVEAGVVVENTDPAERAELIARYSNGDLQVLVNVMVFTEGFDAPATEIIANCRPTKSEALYLQIIGRATRPLAGVVDGPETAEARKAAIAASGKQNCIAEGQRILTDHGLVEIQNVTRAMKLWDGIEFVTHCGIVSRGERRVITYAGLTATPDHKVWIHDETSRSTAQENRASFGWCAEQQARLRVTGIGREAIREAMRCHRGDSAREAAEKCSFSSNGMRLRKSFSKRLFESDSRESRMQEVRLPMRLSCVAVEKNSRRSATMRKSIELSFQKLRGTRNKNDVREQSGHGEVDCGEHWTREGQDARPNRQRRTLCARKYQVGYGNGPGEQPARSAHPTGGPRFFVSASRSELLSVPPEENDTSRNDVEANSRSIQSTWAARSEPRKARVFDIINSGPRNRFTAEGILVSNCTILDFVGNSGDIKLISVADVLAGDKVDPIDLAEALRIATASGETVDIEELAEKAKQARLEAEKQKEIERQQRLLTNTKADRADYSTVDVDLFGGPTFDTGDKYVEPITKAQQGFLYHQLGLTRKQTKHMSKKQAKGLIGKTFKQAGDDWKRLIKEADTVGQLQKVGKAISDRKSSDYLLKDERLVSSLREAYKARKKELGAE